MKSITIHKMPAELAEQLERCAAERGESLNRTVKALLSDQLGLAPGRETDHTASFRDGFGNWSEAEAREFKEATADFDAVESEEWA